MEPFFTLRNNRLFINIKVNPCASKSFISGIKNRELVIKIKAPPVKGKANKELIHFLYKTLKTPKSDIHLISGITSPHKILSLNTSVRFLLEKLF